MSKPMCVCGHPYRWHGESGQTAPTEVCHGWHGNATPGPYRQCDCTGYRPIHTLLSTGETTPLPLRLDTAGGAQEGGQGDG